MTLPAVLIMDIALYRVAPLRLDAPLLHDLAIGFNVARDDRVNLLRAATGNAPSSRTLRKSRSVSNGRFS